MLETIWNSILPNILEIIFTIISLVVARYVIPCIKNDIIPWLKEKHLYGTIKRFVQAVEKMAESGAIPKCDKKDKVIELLASKGIAVNPVIDAFIESCVKELDMVGSIVYEEILEGENVEVETESN